MALRPVSQQDFFREAEWPSMVFLLLETELS